MVTSRRSRPKDIMREGISTRSEMRSFCLAMAKVAQTMRYGPTIKVCLLMPAKMIVRMPVSARPVGQSHAAADRRLRASRSQSRPKDIINREMTTTGFDARR